MTLRTRLFLFFGALIAVLASAELWLVRSLSQDLEVEAEGLALSVGSSLVQAFSGAVPVPGALDGLEHGIEVHSFHWADHPDGISFSPRALEAFDPADCLEWPDPADSAPEGVEPKEPDGAGQPAPKTGPIVFRPGGSTRITKLRSTFLAGPARLTRSLLPSGTEPAAQRPESSRPSPDGGQVLALRIAVEGDGEHLDGFAKEMVLDLFEYDGQLDQAMPLVQGPASTMVSVPLERAGLRRAMERFRSRLVLGSAAILGLGLLVAGLVAHRVSEPLRQLSQAARAVGEGEFGVQVPPTGDEEVRGTLQAFNAMSERLAELDAEADHLREGQHLSELGDIARGLAHSLRNPLHVLGLSVDRLAIGAEPGLGQAARAHIERIDRTLRSLLVLSSAGPEDCSEVDLADVARDVALELLQDPGSSHSTQVQASAPAFVRGVPAELRAVVHVLMVNAAEASPADHPIVVRVEALPEGAELCVFDDGPGLAPEVRASLFKPHTTSKAQGAGMGLYLAQRIASNRYGGSLTIEDRPEGGTLARLRLMARESSA